MSVYPAGVPVNRTANLSSDGLYRYSLTRRWAVGPLLTFIMLNPSTADHELDDPTIRRCVGFAVRDGHAGVEVLNLYAYRATKPADMWAAARRGVNIVGPLNDEWLVETFTDATERTGVPVIAAWGAGAQPWRVAQVLALPYAEESLYHLGLTKAGQPRHPLYLPADATPTRWVA